MKSRALLILLVIFFSACKPDKCDTPIGESGAIFLAEYPEIYNNIGGTVVINRGYRGILLRCESFGRYAAFECACPNDHDVRMLPDDERAALTLSCPSCGSRFELINGNPLDGSATTCQLHRYSTETDGDKLYFY